MSSEYNELLVELQEAISELHMLKQIDGTEKLQRLQEKKIYTIQNDLQRVNNSVQLDAVDLILPYKCRTCPEKHNDEERLECYDQNYDDCKREDGNLTPLKMSIFRLAFMFFSVILIMLLFLLMTNIFSKYFTNIWGVFLGSASVTILVVLAFKKPTSQLL